MRGVAIIPARGGSKRIPRKNLITVAGLPMLARPISSANKLPNITEVIVSTDSDEIAELSISLGARVPGLRPDHLALDETPTAPVVAYELERFTQEHFAPDFVVVLYPTSLFVSSDDLADMTSRLESSVNPVEMVMTVVKYPAPVERAWRIRDADVGQLLDPESRNQNSQRFEERYYDAGQAYVSNLDAWIKVDAGIEVSTALYELPVSRCWDINTAEDLEIAEMMLRSPVKDSGVTDRAMCVNHEITE